MSRSNRDWFAQLRLVLLVVVAWFVVTIVDEALGSTVTYVLVGAAVLVFAVVWAVRVLLVRAPDPVAVEETPPPPRLFVPPAWDRPAPLCGRQSEVAGAVWLLRKHGIVVVVGERDVGTSAVGSAVAQELIDRHEVDQLATHRFDLRGRSATTPDDALTIAARVASAWRIAPPTEETMLAAVARELVGRFRASGGTLLLDNVNTPDQVEWLVREWPADGPRLIIVGDTKLVELAPGRTATVGLMSFRDMQKLWRTIRQGSVRPWYGRFFRRPSAAEPDHDLDELFRALLRRPRAVIAIAREISRPGSKVTFTGLLTQPREDKPGAGSLEAMWQTILENVRAVLSDDADRLMVALAALPVTGLIEGAATAMLGAGGPDALKELRNHNLVEKVDGRYRLPQEYRRAIKAVTSEPARRKTAAMALPKLSRFYRTSAEQWATRLESEPEGVARWFVESEPSFRPLYLAEHTDELVLVILDDLDAIADSLTRWYIRIQRPDRLLQVHTGLRDLACRVRSWDVAARAAIRQATAHRMAGVHGRKLRFDDAATALDDAREYREQVPDLDVRTELGARERVERALLAVDRGTGLDEAFADVSQLEVESPAVLIILGALRLGLGEPADAKEYLLRAEKLAEAAGDQGAQAHSLELAGIVEAYDDLDGAVEAWTAAKDMYALIGENQGEARCHQHLGAAALFGWSDTDPVPEQDGAAMALEYLLTAKKLRPHQHTPRTDEYLRLARRRLDE